MRLTRLPVVATAIAAVVSAALVGVGTWDELKGGLLTALSVIAAASLVRLARGLPFTNADQFEPHEVEQVTGAVQQLARSLRAFLGVVISAMVALVLVKPIAGLIDHLWLIPQAKAVAMQVLSGVVGGSLGYVLGRLWQIVGSDLSLLDKQSEFMNRAVHRKARAKDEARDAELGAVPFKTPENYGRRLQ